MLALLIASPAPAEPAAAALEPEVPKVPAALEPEVPKPSTYRLVAGPELRADELDHATLMDDVWTDGPPGDSWALMFHGGLQSYDPGDLVAALEANGYRVGASWTPAFALSFSGGGRDLLAGLLFGAASIDIDDGEARGEIRSFQFIGQLGWYARRTTDFGVYPLVGVGVGVSSVSANTEDPQRFPILRGQDVDVAGGFDVDAPGLLLELGAAIRTVLPLVDDGQGGIALELQLVYVMLPLAGDWSESRQGSGPSIAGPSPTFGGPLLRLGVGWGADEIDLQRRTVAVPSCGGRACKMVCHSGFRDCDGDPRNGCEARIGSIDHCLGCGDSCAAPHAAAVCESAACQIISCEAGFADCDGDRHNGCERGIDRDALHCGGCGAACASGQICQAGACRDAVPASPATEGGGQ